MVEIDRNLFSTDVTFRTDKLEFWKDLYKLGCYFLASKRWHDDGPPEFSGLRKWYEEDMIASLLISTAIKLRNKFDVLKDEAEMLIRESGADVGELQKDIESSSIQKLNLREACNKIIHTKQLNFDYDDSYPEPVENQVLNLKIHLYGDHHNKKWKATIHIMKFIDSAALCIPEQF